MIDKITGTLIQLSESLLIVQVGPLALQVHVPNSFLYEGKSEVCLFTSLQWHQEQGPLLYGFSSLLERTVFLLVIQCSGIGPKIGLALLHEMNPDLFISLIQTNNQEALSKVPGIGAKKAEQLVVQLRHKIKKLENATVNTNNAQQLSEVMQTLSSLNYSRTEITAALDHLYKHNTNGASFDQLLRTALSFLTKKSIVTK